ncbi:acetyltransferase [Lactobacillus sp. DCY120]|uniref:Acetyltransferase n=1 Tax=Bombilactobacillus apium TaxID=2675299 RepID=A0A850R067_9LACO|nr:acyltransferase family protein [Bombilactobacillus apium]NVY95740.1 acetyltransferase [Bombilactobacillus apium]
MKKATNSKRYITGFNGLRTLGVVGVILYHINPNLFAGGYLGVPIFLGLTGYLISNQVLSSLNKTGTFQFKDYYIKRFKRLYPNLLLMLFSASAYIVCFQRNLLGHLWSIFWTNVANVYNFWQIIHGQSYFERFANNESPFTHMWTLSIQGQFYFLAPLCLWFLFRRFSRQQLAGFLASVTILSAVLMAFLYQPQVDPSRVYYGTDTRLFSLTLGSLLAVIWPLNKLKTKLEWGQRWCLNLIGAVCFASMLYLMFKLKATSGGLYYGGMFLFSLVTMILIAIIAHPASIWNRLLSNPFFDEIGKLSYGIYLYQFPVMIFFESKVHNIADHPYLYPIIEILLILLISILAYNLVEAPLARKNWHLWGQQLLHFKLPRWESYLTGGVLVIMTLGTCGLVQSVQAQDQPDANQSKLAQNIKKNKTKNENENKKALKNLKKHHSTKEQRAQIAHWKEEARINPVNQKYQKLGISQFDLQRAQSISALAIGDSVMVNGSSGLREIFPNLIINAAVSRQADAALPILQSYQTQGILPATVVIGLGTNGPVSESQIKEIMTTVGPKTTVLWINVHVPTRTWEHSVNATLQRQAQRYSNLKVIDWQNYSAKHSEWFYTDSVHTNPQGTQYYSILVARGILKAVKY